MYLVLSYLNRITANVSANKVLYVHTLASPSGYEVRGYLQMCVDSAGHHLDVLLIICVWQL